MWRRPTTTFLFRVNPERAKSGSREPSISEARDRRRAGEGELRVDPQRPVAERALRSRARSVHGRDADRVGRFQLADRGTLFLDEVGEIPPDLQSMLLRVLHEGDFERVGDETSRHVNVRVIAAPVETSRADVDAGRFRLDLFYRLAVLPMQVPPLRERREDVPALTDRFVRLASEWLRREPPKVSEREMAKLVAYAWPGNIRELQHVVERAVILAPPGDDVQFDVRLAVEEDVDPRRPIRASARTRNGSASSGKTCSLH